MGVIKNQAIKGSIWSYIGVLLGFVNLVVLSQKFFTTEQIGLTQVLISIATIFSQVGTLGLGNVAIRMFPYFRNDKNTHNGFIGLSIWIGLVGFIIMVIITGLTENYFVETNSEKSSLLATHYYYTYPLIFFMLFFTLFDTYNRMLLNAVLGTFLKEFVVRIANTLCILLFIFKIISFDVYVLFFVVCQALPTLILGIILAVRNQLTLKFNYAFLSHKLRFEMSSIALFGIISGLSSMVMQNVDRLMVNHFIGLDAAGVYSIAFFFGTLILIPQRAISNISTTVISNSWKENDLVSINTIYQKSSISQLLVGVLLFIGIWGNINNVFMILEEEYTAGKWVIFFIGLANLIIVFFGNSYYILITSASYRIAMWFIIMLFVLVIVTNYIFIQLWGITGAAFASFLSMTIYQLSMCLYLYFKFKIKSDYKSALIIVVFGFIAYGLVNLIPQIHNFWIDIITRSFLLTVAFCVPIYFLRISPDINQKAEEIFIQISNIANRYLKNGKN